MQCYTARYSVQNNLRNQIMGFATKDIERWLGLLGQDFDFLKWNPCGLRLSTAPPLAPLRPEASGAVDNQMHITLPVRLFGSQSMPYPECAFPKTSAVVGCCRK